jgi:sugar O-acyltransferase (sialic acid O-acetyltransferase NeuD family)
MKKEKIVIFGTGQLASLAHFYFTHDTCHEVVAFTMDGEWITDTSFENKPVVPFEEVEKLYPPTEYKMFAPLSFKKMSNNRKDKFYAGKEKGYTFVSYVSSKASTWPDLDVGENCFIFEDNTIQPYVKIGDNCVMWSGNHIGHHSVIHDHVFMTSHVVISGCCNIKNNSFFGVNSTVRDETTIGEYSLIGMGAIITKDTKPFSVWFGAKAIEKDFKSIDIDSISHKTNG